MQLHTSDSPDDVTMSPPNDDRDYTKELQEFIIHLSEQPGRESVASEIEGKSSILSRPLLAHNVF